MTSDGARPKGVPIAVQVGILLLISLLAAQAISVLLLFVSPPPPIPIYELSEVATALKGGTLDTRFGRRLERTSELAPPTSPEDRHGFRQEAMRRTLAMMMQVPEERLRFVWIGRPAHDEMERRRLPPGFRHPPPPSGMGPPPPPSGAPSDGPPPPGPPSDAAPRPPPAYGGPRPFEAMRMGGAVMGAFVAGFQEADGRWTVVRSPHEPLFSAWRRRMVLWLLSCLVIIGPAAYLFARRITAPIDRFAKAAQALGRDPRAPPMTLSGPAEIGEAARAFNDMQARIRRYVEDRTAMVGAISHDLRTPLARIRYKLEAAPQDLKALVLSDVERMEQMIGQVLAFIREANETAKRERLDLLSIVECVADEASFTGGDVEITDAESMAVQGDGLALQRMLTNLVDNAVKYGGRARIQVFEAGGEAVIEIRDSGPGLPDGELERVFAPFYRPNAARTLDDGGVGLGLSVARSIARAHGGEIDLRPALEGGLITRVRLPLAEASTRS